VLLSNLRVYLCVTRYGHSLGSHGSSCIVDPTGVIVAEASCDGEEVSACAAQLRRTDTRTPLEARTGQTR